MSQGSTTTPGRRAGLPLGRPLGVPVYLAPSWLVGAVIITLTQADIAARLQGRVQPTAEHYLMGVVVAALIGMSVLAHELGHSAVSLLLGIPIRRITLFLLGGVAEIEREPDTPAREYLVAVAGPLVTLLLGGLFTVAGVLAPEGGSARLVLLTLGALNAAFALLNLLPGLPLDGGRVLRAAIWRLTGDQLTGTRTAVRSGQAIAGLIGALGVLELSQGRGQGLITLLIASFIWASARQIRTRAEVVDRLAGLVARTLARPAIAVPAGLPLAEALRQATEQGGRAYVVDSAGVPSHLVDQAAAEAVPQHRRPWVSVADVAHSVEPRLVLSAELSGEAVLATLQTTGATDYLVVEPGSGAVAGVLSAGDVAQRLAGRR